MNEGEIRGTVTPRGQVRGSIGGGGVTGRINIPDVVTSDDYLNLRNKPIVNGETLIGEMDSEDLHIVACKTTAEWAELTTLQSVEGEIYIYSDGGGTDDQGHGIPKMKVGDGNAYVVDLPFCDSTDSRITNDMIAAWNDKVSVRVAGDQLIFY